MTNRGEQFDQLVEPALLDWRNRDFYKATLAPFEELSREEPETFFARQNSLNPSSLNSILTLYLVLHDQDPNHRLTATSFYSYPSTLFAIEANTTFTRKGTTQDEF